MLSLARRTSASAVGGRQAFATSVDRRAQESNAFRLSPRQLEAAASPFGTTDGLLRPVSKGAFLARISGVTSYESDQWTTASGGLAFPSPECPRCASRT